MTTDPIDSFLGEKRNAVVAGLRQDGRPSMTPNWFFWDGSRFYISTMRPRAKFRIFRRDPRVQVLIDDATGFRSVLIDGTAEIWEDHEQGLPYYRAVREKYGRDVGSDDELRANLVAEDRVLLVITPSGPRSSWR
ncbi:MAG TPA: TIGR03618 family F420-dependent PPOX class oxidoreductase, partial [Acidimicrobiales bacterium]|nr:TIGR03618 family F420-dependent PPOX class oxidoreductase [Acidimicrobiales bacterium]